MEEKVGAVIAPRAIKFYVDRKMTPITESVGLRNSCGPILLYINHNEGTALSELSDSLMVDKALITRMVKIMLDDGFIEDRKSGSHGYSLYMTDKGKRIAEVLRDGIKSVREDMFRYVTDEERAVLDTVIKKILTAIREDTE